jgi:import inner membrane translocase subunit TIM23
MDVQREKKMLTHDLRAPVPDFYGEKVQSVSGYRQWLKDQRAFTRKKTRAVL